MKTENAALKTENIMQQSRIENLEGDNKLLRNGLSSLKGEVAQLKARLGALERANGGKR